MTLSEIEVEISKFKTEVVLSIMNETKLNTNIEKYLKPVKKQLTSEMYEIVFDPDARLVKYFEAAVKTWRIMQPNFISVVNEGLEDQHIITLCKFLLN